MNGNAFALFVGILICSFFYTDPQVLNNKLYIVYILYNIRAKACDVEVLMVLTVKILVFWGFSSVLMVEALVLTVSTYLHWVTFRKTVI
jgi:hypothetical protein